ncbi:MAG: dTDP-4-dehydrorhamnose reductase [Gemmatimonadetes bacterium]|nr:dTDP-4-dehydrorhamnose reductase [Gemmatimonadota bacterium]
MRLLVTGAGGLLGSEFVRFGMGRGEAEASGASPGTTPPSEAKVNVEIVGLLRTDLDVTDGPQVVQAMGDLEPDWVVHCAAYTAVDRAEQEPEEAMRVNRDGTANVAAAAAGQGVRLLYISTDYVFDGRKDEPYLPSDPVAPLSVYGETKLAGEETALAAGGVAVRTGWLYGAGGGNFVDGILRRAERGESLRVVDDQRGRPTWTKNVAEGVVELLVGHSSAAVGGRFGGGAQDLTGVWHLADGGDATWLELARAAVRLRGLDVGVEGVSSEEWGAPAPRPTYTVLDLAATEAALGRSMMPWRDALERYVGTREG